MFVKKKKKKKTLILYIPIRLDRSVKADNFYEKFSRLHQQSQPFSRIGCKIWNKLPQYLRKKRRFSFKNCLNQILLRFLEHEDSYVDLNTLIQKLPLLAE